MFVIAGATGQVGSAAADRLLDHGAPVRVLVRDPAKATAWQERGAQVVAVDLGDRAGLTAALDGATGAFVLLPFDTSTTDFHAQVREQVSAIAGAVADSGVHNVVAMSSVGAHLAEGTGPIVGLHHLEEALAATGAVVSAIRSGHFQEKVTEVLDVVRHEGIYPVFADSADLPKTMIATRDIGEVVAATLQAPPARSEIVELDGPTYTEREVAGRLGAMLGRDLQVVTIPAVAWVETLIAAGLSQHVAEVMVGLYEAEQRGVLSEAPGGDRRVRCTTDLGETLARLVGVAV